MFHVPEKYRFTQKGHVLSSDANYGNNGFFVIKNNNGRDFEILASEGTGWEHVSVKVWDRLRAKERTPLWDEMCEVKNIFWDEEDLVIQIHPPKSEYVNFHPSVLHLWRQVGGWKGFEFPPSFLIGPKAGK